MHGRAEGPFAEGAMVAARLAVHRENSTADAALSLFLGVAAFAVGEVSHPVCRGRYSSSFTGA